LAWLTAALAVFQLQFVAGGAALVLDVVQQAADLHVAAGRLAIEADVLGRIEKGDALPLSCCASSPRSTLEVPTNSATKVVAGFMYRLRGVSTCSMRPG
jgi:hypothetical protein